MASNGFGSCEDRPPVVAEGVGDELEECEGRLVTRMERERLVSVFQRFQHDGEIHRHDLPDALQLCGYSDVRDMLVQSALAKLTPYCSLNSGEFVRFVCLYEDGLHQKYRVEFQNFDRDSSGTVAAEDLRQLFASLGLFPRKRVLEEIVREVDQVNVGRFTFVEFERVLDLLRAWEGFSRAELERFRRVFQNFDRDRSGDMSASELSSALAWLGFPLSSEKVRLLSRKDDADGNGTLSECEFLRCLRSVNEDEVKGIQEFFSSYGLGGANAAGHDRYVMSGAALEELVRSLGYSASSEAVMDAAQDAGLCAEDATGLTRPLSLQWLHMELDLDDVCHLLCTLRDREGFTHSEMEELRHAFTLHNPEGRREIATPAIRRALRWLGHPFPFDVVQQLVADVDVDGDSGLDFTMFVKLSRKCREVDRQNAVAVFRAADVDASGLLDDAQQREAFRSLGCVDEHGDPPNRTAAECAAVDVQSFLRIVQRFREELLEVRRANAGYTGAEMAELRACFKKFDKDDDGEINRKELARLIEVLFPLYAHAAEWRPYLKQLLSEIDTDNSGSLDFQEFICLMRKMRDQEDETRLADELRVVRMLGFTFQEVNEFRNLFLAAVEDSSCRLSFEGIQSMLLRCGSVAEKHTEVVRGFFQKVLQASGNESETACFVDFLRVMRMVSDSSVVASTSRENIRRSEAWMPELALASSC